MTNQLVLQFPASSAIEAMFELEERLTCALGEEAEVDGHNVGKDEVNIFIRTNDPSSTFDLAKRVLERNDQLEWVTAAYRNENEENFTVLWPENWRKGFKLSNS